MLLFHLYLIPFHSYPPQIMAPVRSRKSKIKVHTDVILPTLEHPYMNQIISGEKNYEFRTYLIKPSVKRVWFYLTAPSSSIKYVCEIGPARTRNPGDKPLDEDCVGNKEFNENHKDWERYDFAYQILSIYELTEPITLVNMRDRYGMRSAPRGMMYVPEVLVKDVAWDKQKKLR